MTLIIVDYDDTLLCSSHIRTSSTTVVPEDIVEVATSVITFLEEAMKHGTVVIVTNGELAWVHLTVNKYMPTVAPILQRLRVISARDAYFDHHPLSPYKWKYHAFEALLHEVQPSGVLSVGDSLVERKAILQLGSIRKGILTKSVKFVDAPTPQQLRCQLIAVTSQLAYLCTVNSNLDLQLTIR